MYHFHIIMPIGSDNLASQKLEIVKEVAGFMNLKVLTPIYDFSVQNHSKSIANRISDSIFGIADLTGARPSCYYELGISETLGKRMYLIASENSEIHQTSNRDSIKFYSDLLSYKNILQTIIELALSETDECVSKSVQ